MFSIFIFKRKSNIITPKISTVHIKNIKGHRLVNACQQWWWEFIAVNRTPTWMVVVYYVWVDEVSRHQVGNGWFVRDREVWLVLQIVMFNKNNKEKKRLYLVFKFEDKSYMLCMNSCIISKKRRCWVRQWLGPLCWHTTTFVWLTYVTKSGNHPFIIKNIMRRFYHFD